MELREAQLATGYDANRNPRPAMAVCFCGSSHGSAKRKRELPFVFENLLNIRQNGSDIDRGAGERLFQMDCPTCCTREALA